MGQKVNPRVFRLNTVRTWPSKWFVRPNEYAQVLRQDVRVRKMVQKLCKEAGVAAIDIERSPNVMTVTIHAAKPGVVIGRGGKGIDDLRKKIAKEITLKGVTLNVRMQEIDRPNVNAELVVQSIAADLEKRIPFRRVIKQTLGRIERGGAAGARIIVKGRLDGAEIARDERVLYGKIPLHTLRANVDYARGAAWTIFGAIGIKVWIYLGEVFEKKKA